MRIAGNYEESEGNQVKSVNTSESPALENKSARVSIRYQPTDTITVDAMWQKLKGDSKNFTQVTGAGSPGIPADGVPPNYNGPALSDDDYRAVQEIANTNYLETDLITLNANWDVHGHTLSYNFGSQDTDPRPNGVAVDQSNLLIG